MNENQQFLLYAAPDGEVKMPAINKHLKNIFRPGELLEDSVFSTLETTESSDKNYQISNHLDAIIAVGVP